MAGAATDHHRLTDHHHEKETIVTTTPRNDIHLTEDLQVLLDLAYGLDIDLATWNRADVELLAAAIPTVLAHLRRVEARLVEAGLVEAVAS